MCNTVLPYNIWHMKILPMPFSFPLVPSTNLAKDLESDVCSQLTYVVSCVHSYIQNDNAVCHG